MERLRQTDRAQAWMRRREWPRNALYDQGDQEIRFDGTSLTWARQTRDKKFNRQQADLLGVRGDHWVADLTQGLPAFTGKPENRDLSSRRRAKLAERLMMADWARCNLDLARSLALRDVWRYGSGFIETCWDSESGQVVPVYEPEMDERGNPRLTDLNLPVYQRHPQTQERLITGYKAKGAVVDRALSPFLVYVPITTEVPLMEACAWLERIEWTTQHRIRQMADEPLPEDFSFEDDYQFRYVDDFLAAAGGGERRQRATDAMGLHMVVHYYELRKPIEGFVEGCHYIVTSDQCIAKEPLQGWGECRGDRYPIFLYAGRPQSRSFWSQPEIKSRVPIQRRRNQILTHEMTYLGRYSMPLVVAQKGSEVPEQIPFDGSTVHYAPTHLPPHALDVPMASPALFGMKDAASAELDAVGGDEPASRGVAVRAPSAKYVQYLQDAAAKRVGPMVRQHAWSWARMGEFHCQLHAEYEPDDQILTVIGRRNRPELVSLRADELGAVQFHVQESSLAGSIPAARVETLNSVVPTIFGPGPYPPAMARAFLEFMRMPDALDLESGTSGMDDFVDGVLVRLIDESTDPGIELEDLEPEEIQALLLAITQRKYAGDWWDWSEEDRNRVRQFKGLLQQAVQQQQEQQQVAADKQEQKGIATANAIEEGKQGAQARKGKVVAYAKARAGALAELVKPPPPAPMPGEGDEKNAAG